MTTNDHLRSVVEAVVSAAGYDLEELTVVAAGRRRMLRVVIDSDSGVDLDDAAQVSRELSDRLDELDAADPMGAAAYTLEVTSPGIGRPLELPRHFRRARGRLLAVTTAAGETFLGRVRDAGDDAVELLVGRAGTDPRQVPYADIARARVEVEFNRPGPDVLALLDASTAGKFTQDAPIDADPDGDDPDGDDPDGDDHAGDEPDGADPDSDYSEDADHHER